MLRDQNVNDEGGWSTAVDEHGIECDRLHHQLKRIVKARAALDAQELECLREADRLRMWRRFGCTSLAEYMERELGYSQRAAIERVRVMGAIAGLPAIEHALVGGELSFSAAREITRVATAETEEVWLEATSDKTAREVEAMVAGHQRGDRPDDPTDPSLLKQVVRIELTAETYALKHQVHALLEKELGQRLDEDAVLAAAFRHVLDGHAAARKGPAYEIAVTICARCKRGWQDGGSKTVEMSPASIARAQCDAVNIGAMDRAACDDAVNIGAVDQAVCTDGAVNIGMHPAASVDDAWSAHPSMSNAISRHPGRVTPTSGESSDRSTEGPNSDQRPPRTTWTIPPATRRAVLRRDHGRCRVPGCSSSRNLDLHHIEPLVGHVSSNLLTLCEAHHLAIHSGALKIEGDASAPTFARTHASNYNNAALAAETGTALRTLGFAPHEVKHAMEQARTHVGTAALALQEWIKIALRYCPKPAG